MSGSRGSAGDEREGLRAPEETTHWPVRGRRARGARSGEHAGALSTFLRAGARRNSQLTRSLPLPPQSHDERPQLGKEAVSPACLWRSHYSPSERAVLMTFPFPPSLLSRMAVRIVSHAFEIVHLLTDQNPIQVYVDAVVACGPREDSTRIGSQGASRWIGWAQRVRQELTEAECSQVPSGGRLSMSRPFVASTRPSRSSDRKSVV